MGLYMGIWKKHILLTRYRKIFFKKAIVFYALITFFDHSLYAATTLSLTQYTAFQATLEEMLSSGANWSALGLPENSYDVPVVTAENPDSDLFLANKVFLLKSLPTFDATDTGGDVGGGEFGGTGGSATTKVYVDPLLDLTLYISENEFVINVDKANSFFYYIWNGTTNNTVTAILNAITLPQSSGTYYLWKVQSKYYVPIHYDVASQLFSKSPLIDQFSQTLIGLLSDPAQTALRAAVSEIVNAGGSNTGGDSGGSDIALFSQMGMVNVISTGISTNVFKAVQAATTASAVAFALTVSSNLALMNQLGYKPISEILTILTREPAYAALQTEQKSLLLNYWVSALSNLTIATTIQANTGNNDAVANAIAVSLTTSSTNGVSTAVTTEINSAIATHNAASDAHSDVIAAAIQNSVTSDQHIASLMTASKLSGQAVLSLISGAFNQNSINIESVIITAVKQYLSGIFSEDSPSGDDLDFKNAILNGVATKNIRGTFNKSSHRCY